MFNGIFNFNFLALLLTEILRGSQMYTRGPYTPWTPPSGEFVLPKANTSQYLIVFNFNILALVLFGILGGPKFTLGALRSPEAPSGNFFIPEASTLLCLMAFLISTF